MKKCLRIVLGGASGRMGRQIAALALCDDRFRVTGGVGAEKSPPPGDFTYGPAKILPRLLKQADVLIDFSLPQPSLGFAAAAAAARTPMVVGTTGFTPRQTSRLLANTKSIPMFVAPNMSPGMNLLFELASRAAAALPDYDAVISETHHSKKLDAPSGSALRLADSVRRGRGGKLPVPTVSLRAGSIIGDHTLHLVGPDERLELTHRAQDRSVFARGALEAAQWLAGRRPGLYTMRDRLGL